MRAESSSKEVLMVRGEGRERTRRKLFQASSRTVSPPPPPRPASRNLTLILIFESKPSRGIQAKKYEGWQEEERRVRCYTFVARGE